MENTFNITLSNGEVQTFSRADMALIYNTYRLLMRKEYIKTLRKHWSNTEIDFVARQSIFYESEYCMNEDDAIEEAIDFYEEEKENP